jgi:asparagine synthetase B (glutamine-hydrolysing)
MFGLLGCFVKKEINEKILGKSLKTMLHRGPDSSGILKYNINAEDQKKK